MTFEEEVRKILETNFDGFKEEIIDDVARSIAMFHDREALQDIENCKTAFKRYMNCKGCPDCPTYEEFCMGFGCKEAYTDKASECGRNMDFSERQKIICNSILEIEPCEYAPFTIDELKDEDMQKLLREFNNQRVIVTDHDCLPSATIIEPCEDAISRQAVLDYIRRILNQGTGKKKSFEFIQKYVANLPSVTPKPKTGHWILLDECSNSGYYCSECCKKVIKEGWSGTIKKIKYCPNCGTKMV